LRLFGIFRNLGKARKVASIMHASVSFEKSMFTFIMHFAWVIPILLSFAILWIQWSMN